MNKNLNLELSADQVMTVSLIKRGPFNAYDKDKEIDIIYEI